MVDQAKDTRESEADKHPIPEAECGVANIFDLGDSGNSNIAAVKDSMIAEASESLRNRTRHL